MKEYEDDDGWNKDFFDGLFKAEDIFSDLFYEIDNCRRNRSLSDIREELEKIINNLEEVKDRVSDEEESEDKD